MQQFQEFIAFIENSGLAEAIREDDALFPLIESVHVLAICLVVGSILAVDLRLLGMASRGRPVASVMEGVLPLTWSAFAVAAASGSLLFISNATRYLGNEYFVAKLLLIGAAGLNMATFHALNARRPADWADADAPPAAARLAGGLSIVLWIAIVACGRWIGFTMQVR